MFGRCPKQRRSIPPGRPAPRRSARALLTALDGKRVKAGPPGAPQRGRRDVLPTGRNLYTADPRMLPTQTAMELGRLAADDVIRLYLQTHGEMPRALVIDLWGSATLRTGGEEIAQGLALMGCRPIWDAASARVTGIEVLPPAAMGRPRVDVTWRISGLFRDLFPAQIALIDAAVRLVAAARRGRRREPACRCGASRQRRWRAGSPASSARRPALMARASRSCSARTATKPRSAPPISPPRRMAMAAPTARARHCPARFADRVATADLLLHGSDDPSRDLLEGAEDVAHVGGFAAAAASLGREAELVMLDTTDPNRPRARTLDAALARIVRGRADQSALHRRPDAARRARRGGARRDRRPAGRFRRDDRRGVERAVRLRA